MTRTFHAFAGALLLTGALHAAESGPWKSTDGEVAVTVSSVPADADSVFPTNRLTSILVRVTTVPPDCGTVSLDFDAAMPGHGHGMNTRARTTRIAPQEFRVDGIKLHMPGSWLMSFRVACENGVREIDVPLDL